MLKTRAGKQIASNKHAGAAFERIFLWRASIGGLLAQKNELSFRYAHGGKVVPIRTNLDFTLIDRDGRHAYCDTKSFDKPHLTLSMIDKHQLARALTYAKWNVAAGFVVWLKPLGRVVYFSGALLGQVRPRSRVLHSAGVDLGSYADFSLLPIFSTLP